MFFSANFLYLLFILCTNLPKQKKKKCSANQSSKRICNACDWLIDFYYCKLLNSLTINRIFSLKQKKICFAPYQCRNIHSMFSTLSTSIASRRNYWTKKQLKSNGRITNWYWNAQRWKVDGNFRKWNIIIIIIYVCVS